MGALTAASQHVCNLSQRRTSRIAYTDYKFRVVMANCDPESVLCTSNMPLVQKQCSFGCRPFKSEHARRVVVVRAAMHRASPVEYNIASIPSTSLYDIQFGVILPPFPCMQHTLVSF